MWILARTIFWFNSARNKALPLMITHHTVLEIIWTIIPAIILIFIAVPSFALLYAMDESNNPCLTIKAIGHQWYWSYENSDFKNNGKVISQNFDSYMVLEDDLVAGDLRLLTVDNSLFLPIKMQIRVLVSSSYVLHSWAVPSFGVKTDACPGRLNEINLFILRTGVFYGQCSELCGLRHSFMPIRVVAYDLNDYPDILE